MTARAAERLARCEGKDKLSFRQAKAIANRQRGSTPYRCPFCREWHVGRLRLKHGGKG